MSISERQKNKVYRFRCTSRGTKYELTYYGSKKIAEKAHVKWLEDVRNGIYDLASPLGLNFTELYKLFKDTRRHEASTVSTYDSLLRKLDNDFLIIDIKSVDKLAANKLILDLKAKHTDNTCWEIYKLTKSIFNFAIDLDLIDKNPFAFKYPRPKNNKNNKEELISLDDIDTFMKVLENVDHEHYRMCYLIGMGCGLRISEILGLYVSDIDRVNNKIHISKQYKKVYDKDGNMTRGLGSVKTSSSLRTVNIPTFVQEALYPYLDFLPNASFLIPGKVANSPLTYNAVQKHLKRLCVKINIPALTTHDMRRIYTTLNVYAGNNTKVISDSLGHTTLAMTEKYMRKLDTMNDKATDNLDDFIKIGIKKGQT